MVELAFTNGDEAEACGDKRGHLFGVPIEVDPFEGEIASDFQNCQIVRALTLPKEVDCGGMFETPSADDLVLHFLNLDVIIISYGI